MDKAVFEVVTDAQTWYLLARLLERPRGAWHDDVRALAAGPVGRDVRAAAALAGDATQGEYLDRFGPSGVVSPREAAHCGMRDPGQLLADLQARYGAFGFQAAAEDTLDHVAVEASFVAYLRLKEAYALAEGDAERAAIARDAAATFIADHLQEMGEPIASKLESAGDSSLARAARAVAARVGPPKTRAASKIVWLEEEDAMSCGNAPGVAGRPMMAH